MLDFLITLGPLIPLVIFLAAAAESAAFVGLVVPGELLVVVGGALAGRGAVPLWAALLAGVAGAVVGDALGYGMGARYGHRLVSRPRLARFASRLDEAGAFLERNGWWALVLARFPAMLRAVVPFAAGMARMRYSRFAVGNVTGGVLWGSLVTGLGFAAGSRWEQIEELLRRGGILLAGLVGVVVGLALAARWASRHPSRVRAGLLRLLAVPIVGRAVRLAVTAWGQPRPFLRLVPHLVLLGILVAASLLAAGVDWSFAERRVVGLLAAHRTPLVSAIGARAAAGSGLLPMAVVAGLGGLVALALRRARPGLLVTSAFLVQASVVATLNRLVDRPYGPFPLEMAVESPFPSPLAANLAGLAMALAWPWAGGWTRGVRSVGAGLVLVLTGTAVLVVSGEVYPVDAAAGVTVGVATVLALGMVLDPRLRRHLAAVPPPPGPPPGPSPLGVTGTGLSVRSAGKVGWQHTRR